MDNQRHSNLLQSLLLALSFGSCSAEQLITEIETSDAIQNSALILCHSDEAGCAFESSDNCPTTLPAELDACVEDDGLNSCFYCPGGNVPANGQGVKALFCVDGEWSDDDLTCES